VGWALFALHYSPWGSPEPCSCLASPGWRSEPWEWRMPPPPPPSSFQPQPAAAPPRPRCRPARPRSHCGRSPPPATLPRWEQQRQEWWRWVVVVPAAGTARSRSRRCWAKQRAVGHRPAAVRLMQLQHREAAAPASRRRSGRRESQAQRQELA
jgi:hypothetical protein